MGTDGEPGGTPAHYLPRAGGGRDGVGKSRPFPSRDMGEDTNLEGPGLVDVCGRVPGRAFVGATGVGVVCVGAGAWYM